MRAFLNGTIYTPIETIPDGVILVDRTTIHAIGTRASTPIPSEAEIIDAQGQAIVPGLIDIHTYGCLGVSMTAPEPQSKVQAAPGAGGHEQSPWSQPRGSQNQREPGNCSA